MLIKCVLYLGIVLNLAANSNSASTCSPYSIYKYPQIIATDKYTKSLIGLRKSYINCSTL